VEKEDTVAGSQDVESRGKSLRIAISGLKLSSADSQRELEVRRMHHVQVLSRRIPTKCFKKTYHTSCRGWDHRGRSKKKKSREVVMAGESINRSPNQYSIGQVLRSFDLC
jgi:hypothetical protein